nr:reverse transcriptase domain-containing protein [Tanacetum cinerariifolium]
MIKSSNRETPFSLTCRTEVVIPVEIGMPTWRTTEVDMIKNDEALEINLDLLKEKKEQAAIQEAKSKAMMEKYYNTRLPGVKFYAGEGGLKLWERCGGGGVECRIQILFTDGSSCIDGSGAGLIITNPKGIEFTYALRFRFDATNNEAEYKALIAGLRIAEQIGIKNIQANVDSRLVAKNGTYIAKEPGMIKYLEKLKALTSTFKKFSIKQVPRGENKKAEALSKITSTSFTHLSKQLLVEELKEKSIDEKEVLEIVEEEGRTWMTPIHEYMVSCQRKRKKQGLYAARQKGEIISDNEKQFRDNPFKDWCEKLCIRQCFASVKHPQAIGLVKRVNMSLCDGIKARFYHLHLIPPMSSGLPKVSNHNLLDH